jgi:hypothetical protein
VEIASASRPRTIEVESAVGDSMGTADTGVAVDAAGPVVAGGCVGVIWVAVGIGLASGVDTLVSWGDVPRVNTAYVVLTDQHQVPGKRFKVRCR